MPNSIECPVSRIARISPDFPALVHSSGTVSYERLDRMVRGSAAYLTGVGVTKGSRVILVGKNSVDMISVLLALWRIGAVAVPVNFRFPAEVIKRMIHLTEVTHVFGDNSLLGEHLNQLDSLNHSNPLRIFSLSTREIVCPVKPRGTNDDKTASTNDENEVSGLNRIDISNDAVIIMTSGSTSAEKAVLQTYGNYYYNALGSNENIKIDSQDRWLLSLPLFHVGGLGILFRCILSGAAVVIPSSEETLSQSIITHQVTHVSLVSTQLYRLIEECGSMNPFNCLKAVLLGGSAIPHDLIEKSVALGFPVFTSYGMSEMCSQITTTRPGDTLPHLFTSGKLLKYRELKIEENGEIKVRGEVRFRGYAEGKKIICPFDEEGWFRTGDVGFLDKEEYLHVIGRKDNMFISGGENIIPEEIEGILSGFPGIQQAVVIPVEDKIYGFRPVAFLKLQEIGQNEEKIIIDTAGQLLDDLAKNLPRFKIPDVFYLWPEGVESSLKVKRPFFKELLSRGEGLRVLFKK